MKESIRQNNGSPQHAVDNIPSCGCSRAIYPSSDHHRQRTDQTQPLNTVNTQ